LTGLDDGKFDVIKYASEAYERTEPLRQLLILTGISILIAGKEKLFEVLPFLKKRKSDVENVVAPTKQKKKKKKKRKRGTRDGL